MIRICNALLSAVLLILLSCDGTSIETCPKSSFIGSFPKRSIDLSQRLGEKFELEIAERINNYVTKDTLAKETNPEVHTISDTLSVRIDYDRKSKVNTLVDTKGNDTLFHGLISVYRGYYYMSEKINDTSYWIGIMHIGLDSIQGLGFTRKQMCTLEDFLDQNQESRLIMQNDTVNHIFRLNPEKKLMREIYPEMLKSFPQYKIISEEYDYDFEYQIPTDKSIDTPGNNPQIVKTIVESLYPNPASDHIQVDVVKEAEYLIQLIDSSGKVLLTKKTGDIIIDIPLNGFQKGVYILRVISIDDKLIENHTFIIK